MLNDILTGKSTLQERPPHDPYRDSAEVTRTCITCKKPFQTKSDATRCGTCVIAMASSYSAPAPTFRPSNSHANLRWVLIAFCALGIGAMKMAMRHQYEEDMRSTYLRTEPMFVGYDPATSEANSFASDMCACADEACASNVRARFEHWSATTPAPSEDYVREQVTRAIDQYGACLAKFQ
jgi:hypothetical protein